MLLVRFLFLWNSVFISISKYALQFLTSIAIFPRLMTFNSIIKKKKHFPYLLSLVLSFNSCFAFQTHKKTESKSMNEHLTILTIKWLVVERFFGFTCFWFHYNLNFERMAWLTNNMITIRSKLKQNVCLTHLQWIWNEKKNARTYATSAAFGWILSSIFIPKRLT